MLALSRFLISKGVSKAIADEIIIELSHESHELGYIKDVLAKRIKVTGEFQFQKMQKIALVGPTGVGKTTTIMKLTEFYGKQNKKIALTSVDDSKKKTLQSWADQKGLIFLEVPDSSFSTDLLIIDTEGCNYYQPNRIDALGESLALWGEDVEIALTLSAAAKEVDLYGAVHQFSSLCPESFIFTKLDETLAAGVMINLCVKTDLPVRYAAFGFPLPGEVQVADPYQIIHKILTDFNQEEFQLLRYFALSIN